MLGFAGGRRYEESADTHARTPGTGRTVSTSIYANTTDTMHSTKATTSPLGGYSSIPAAPSPTPNTTPNHDNEQERFEREAMPHRNYLYRVALRLTWNSDEAEDLVQDTFLKAWRFFDKFQPGTNCRAWLFRILRNSYATSMVRTCRNPQGRLPECFEERRASPQDNPEYQCCQRHFDDEVTRALESLPPAFRRMVLLCDVEGFHYEEIAHMEGCPIGTVRSRIHRGRKILREALQVYAGQYGYHPVHFNGPVA
ncbi:MAG: sigma-70 family RNA polymerase sigma factor [Chlorobi bacterium CHB2]|nr:sigma-70 family RNA polymerase sigma factor [Chlorobi bacterium CHB2]